MSRYSCNVFKNGKLVDDGATFGFDEPMQTFFFQSGVEDKDGAPLIWLGYEFKQYSNFSDLLLKLQKHGLALQISEDELALAKDEDIGLSDYEKVVKLLLP